MKPKTLKVLYWAVTILFAVFMLFSGIAELMQTQQSIDVLAQLCYPAYLNIILGVAKVLGVIAILQRTYPTLKEWAYAGFTIDFIGAGTSLYFADQGILMASSVLIFLAVMFTSYFLGKKVDAMKGR